MSTGRRLLGNFLTLFTGNVVGQVLFFVGTLYLARVFGPSAYGIWSFAQAWQLYLLRLGEFGLEVTAIQRIARNPETTARWSASVVVMRLFFATALFAVTLLCGSLGLIPFEAMHVVFLFALCVFPVALVLEWVFEAKQNVIVTSLARVGKGILFIGGILLFVHERTDINASVLVYVVSVAVPSIAVFLLSVRSYGFDRSSFTVGEGVRVIREASSVGVANILSHYSLFVGIMVVGYTLTDKELGYYSAAHRVVVLPWAYVVVSFQRVLLPSLSRWFLESRDHFEAFVGKFFRFTVLGSLTVGIAGTFGGPYLMSVLYSAEYAPAIPVFVILLWALALGGMRFIFEIALIAADRKVQYLKSIALLALMYSILTPLLSAHFGIVGAAWAGVIAECVYLMYLIATFPYLSLANAMKSLWKPLLVGCIAVVAGMSLEGHHFLLQTTASLASFLGLAMLARIVSYDDILMLGTLLKKSKGGDTSALDKRTYS